MRDFRDAKAMAQTLREALNARSVSLTHSESLEMIAKVLGFQDWNVLAARIQSGSAKAALQNDAKHPGTPAREEVAVDANVLDGYVGFYQLNEHAVFTVTRDGTHLVTRLTGQGEVPVYAESKTEVFRQGRRRADQLRPWANATGRVADPTSRR